MKASMSVVLLISLVLSYAILEFAEANDPPAGGVPDFCEPKCADRCSKNPRNLCKKLCMKCCEKCKCVPTGPTGDKAECPCYRDMVGSKGQSKCP